MTSTPEVVLPHLEDTLDELEIQHTFIGDIPTFYTDEDGLMFGGIAFRSGVVDETLLSRGLNHIIEHMALDGIRTPGFDYNGSTDSMTTRFFAHGAPDQVAEFVNRVGRKLQSFDPASLEVQRRILQMEPSRAGPWDDLLIARYGVHSYGLSGCDQFGLRHLTSDDLASYAKQHFTKSSAVMFFSSKPPAGIDLRLPDGPTIQAPDPMKQLGPVRPQVIRNGPIDATLFHAVVKDSAATACAASLLDQKVRDLLRYERGVAYSPEITYQSMPEGAAFVFGVVDSRAEDVAHATELLLWVLDTLAVGSWVPIPFEIEQFRAKTEDTEDLRRSKTRVAPVAESLNMGVDIRLSMPPITADEVRRAAESIRRALYVQSPAGVALPPDFEELSFGGGEAARGVVFPSNSVRDSALLVVGDDAVTLVADEQTYTVRDIEVCARFDDARVIIGGDGASLTLTDQWWIGAHKLFGCIDRAFASRTIDMRRPIGDAALQPFFRRKDFTNLVGWLALTFLALASILFRYLPDSVAPYGGFGALTVAVACGAYWLVGRVRISRSGKRKL